MQVVHPICYGIEGYAAQLPGYRLRVRDDGTSHTAWRDLGTTDEQLLAWRTWRNEPGCPIAVLESTGVYWQSISHVVANTWEVVSPMHARCASSQTKRPIKPMPLDWRHSSSMSWSICASSRHLRCKRGVI